MMAEWPRTTEPMKNWRINLIFLLLVLIGAIIASRLVCLQIFDRNLYKALAQGQQEGFKFPGSKRGSLFFSTGQLLAADSFPFGTMASNLTGFIGGEGIGQYGIEGYYDQELAENDLFLTVDYNAQFVSEQLLAEAGKNFNIESGQIVIMDPNSGRILALADYPGFDPNNYSKVADYSIFQNGAVQKLFEPGSTLKPITISAALDAGKINPQTSFDDTGRVKVDDYIIENYGGASYGESTMTQVLEKSINTGVVFAEKQIGHETFLNYLRNFGFFEPTEIDLQGEVYSENKQFQKVSDINFATAAFGQGIEITPIQLVRAVSAIANGGNLVKPYVAEKTINNYGNIEEKKPEISSQKVISPQTASQVTAMLVSAVENGFSKTAQIPGYYIAGKTGTAQVPWSALGIDKRGYSEKTWQSFIGYFPAFNPKFIILVKLDNPKANTAEYSAAPIFKQMAQYLINYYSIPPDH